METIITVVYRDGTVDRMTLSEFLIYIKSLG
jgi:hypothetical protein